MHNRLHRMFCIMLFSLLTTAVFAQQEFSADVVDDSQKNVAPHKIFVGKDKMRIDSRSQGSGSGTLIINFITETTDILIPERKMYVESTKNQTPFGPQRTFSFFRADPENACDDWRKMAPTHDGACRKIGNDTVNGRSTIKYEGTSEGAVNYIWIDPKLHFPVKWQTKSETTELRNIEEGSQPAGLFMVPPGYQKMDVGNMGMPGAAPRR